MGLRSYLCFMLSRQLMHTPAKRTAEHAAYSDWRRESLTNSWQAFSDEHVIDKDVLDFGCGEGPLSLHLAREKRPRQIVGVDLDADAIGNANHMLSRTTLPPGVDARFVQGTPDRIPVPDRSFDTLLAFDCLEHVMSPGPILREWYRLLRPGGRCLIEWFPYKGPWGPHMEALIPIPWAHVLFGERAMIRAAEKIYDLPEFVPRHWDLDGTGRKKPNKWRNWSSFDEQAYINKLDIKTFRNFATQAGFDIPRCERHSFGGSGLRRRLGHSLIQAPLIGEYFVSYVIIELQRPISAANTMR